MKTMRNNSAVLLLPLLSTLLFASCLSLPPGSAFRPDPVEQWSTEGVQRIAVLPFEVIGNSDLERQTAENLRMLAAAVFYRTGRFTIVDTPDQADAVFRGELIDILQEQRSRRRSDGTSDWGYEISIVFSYRLIRTSDNSIVGESSIHHIHWNTFPHTGGHPLPNYTADRCQSLMVFRLYQDLGHEPPRGQAHRR